MGVCKDGDLRAARSRPSAEDDDLPAVLAELRRRWSADLPWVSDGEVTVALRRVIVNDS